MTIDVIIQNDHFIKTPDQALFQKWIDSVVQTLAEKNDSSVHELCIRIVDKTESAHLNETYRHKKGPTNVLSFTYPQLPNDNNYLGDLVICADVVLEEAKQQNKNPLAHWAHLTVHGTLHLFGYDHIEDHEATIMENLEIKILNQLGFPNPYNENEEEQLINGR